MSRIDDLMQQLCPNGVEFRRLGNVIKLNFGTRITKRNDAGALYPVYGGGGESFRTDNFNREDEYVVSRFALSPTCVRKVEGKFWMLDSGFTFDPVDDSIDKNFVAYLLFNMQPEIYACSSQGAQKNLKTDEFKRFQLPVPPVEVQREIVRVLDSFHALQTDLEAQLGTEMGARQKQYELVVSRIIAGIDAGHETLRDLGNWRGGITPSKSEPRYWESGTIPWLASMDVSESEGRAIRGRVTPVALAETSLRVVPSPSVVVVMRSNILRRRLPVGMTTVETTLNQDVKALSPRDGIDPEYVYQVLRATSEQIRAACVRVDGSMAAVESKAFFDWSIPIPSLQDQKRIVSQLSAFEAVMGELSISLPAELNARRKQYEYYRNRLLTFEELAA